jgi:release factor glutamine methyltransferase
LSASCSQSPDVPVASTAALLAKAETVLAERSIETARLDAEVMLGHALGLTRAGVYTHLATSLAPCQCERFWDLVQRRAQREPLSYITGVREFWSLELLVTPEVLIPRPETELVVDTGLQLLSRSQSRGRKTYGLRILDIGTGSGCLAVVLAKELPEAEVWAIDIEPAALTVAQHNAQRHQVSRRIHFQQSDLFSSLSSTEEQFDLIVSNPPYIARSALSTLQPEVRDWEPRTALDGGDDGLDFYRRLVNETPSYLRSGGWLVMEVGAGQASDVLSLLHSDGNWHWPERFSVQDYAGHERVIVAYKV